MATNLADKLRRWQVGGPARPRPTRPAGGIEAVIPGRFLETSRGACFIAERRLPLETPQGQVPLSAALDLSPRARTLLTRGVAPELLDPRRALYLDTETTGLSGGTGTYAFLVGVGFVDGAEFVVQQYFMRHPGEEAALLRALEEVLAAFPLWVTFNGKAFDVPLLDTRYRYNERRPAPAPALHLDLLHPARRLWRSRLPSCALSTLERVLLGVQRQGDVPSWAIPGLYFDYVRRARCEPLRAVFSHNVDDVLSMVGLVGLFGQIFDRPADHADQVDAVALLRQFVAAGHLAEAREWCAAALPRVAPSARDGLRWELATLLRRSGDRGSAAALWQELATERGAYRVAAQVELAKHFEHREGDYHAATRIVEAALAAITVSGSAATATERQQLERRLGRLHYRARQAASRSAPRGEDGKRGSRAGAVPTSVAQPEAGSRDAS